MPSRRRLGAGRCIARSRSALAVPLTFPFHAMAARVSFTATMKRAARVLKGVGTHKYAVDPNTEVLCCAFAVDDQPVQLWIPGDPVPPEFIEAANDPNWIVAAHGDHFETAIERHIMAPRFGWPEIPLERHAAQWRWRWRSACRRGWRAAADALELAERKDAAGERLMHQMSKPRRARQGEDPRQHSLV